MELQHIHYEIILKMKKIILKSLSMKLLHIQYEIILKMTQMHTEFAQYGIETYSV